MKAILLFVLYLGAFANVVDANRVKNSLSLKKPEIEIPASKKEKLLEFDKLLQEKAWEEFYTKSINAFSLDMDAPTSDDYIGDCWVSFYIAAVPFYDNTFTNGTCVLEGDRDYRAKLIAAQSLCKTRFFINDDKVRKINKPYFLSIIATYYAQILKDFRKEYDPDLFSHADAARKKIKELQSTESRVVVEQLNKEEEKEKNLVLEKELTEKEQEKRLAELEEKKWDAIRTRINAIEKKFQPARLNIGTISAKKEGLDKRIKRLENDFVDMLVEFFPGKGGEVKKYIRMAGYGEDEISGLIDRTVGRDSRTEFLYKGRKESRDRKRIKS